MYLNIFHSDCLEFLDTKKINADEKSRIQTLSLGLVIPDKFMTLCENDDDLCMFYPHTIYKKYGKHLDDLDMNEMYDKLIIDPDVKFKKIKAREMLKQISITQFESGYPYLVFIDNANKSHQLQRLGRIKISNLCTEIFQLQTTSKINDYGEDDVVGYDISCNLGSLNIVNLMEQNEFEFTVENAIRSLTSVSNLSNIKNAPGISKANVDFHSVGLGVMNLHGYLTKVNIPYESDKAIELTDALFTCINYYSIKASNKMAQELNATFKYFEKSTYATGEYFNRYYDKEFEFKDEKVKELFKDIKLPTIQDWKDLASVVKESGLYHSYRMAIAPTQSISYIQNSTASIQPIVNQVETRVYGNSTTYYPMPFMRRDNLLLYKSAYVMDQKKVIDLFATAQKHVDQGISLVLFVTNEYTTKDLAHYYYYAWSKGIKSIYYVRTKNLNIEECETCSV
ncbi:MAG: ribonucleoside-diphosphate reductase subunit alpha [Mycoplasmatales bacterium]